MTSLTLYTINKFIVKRGNVTLNMFTSDRVTENFIVSRMVSWNVCVFGLFILFSFICMERHEINQQKVKDHSASDTVNLDTVNTKRFVILFQKVILFILRDDVTNSVRLFTCSVQCL